MFPEAYFEVRFRVAAPFPAWPDRFAIITAHATTGAVWTAERNATADRSLAAQLPQAAWRCRVTGYSPRSGHAEPGWATALDTAQATALGRRFLQHAIYVVEGDALRVVGCDDGAEAAVGSFRARLDPDGPGTAGRPVAC